MPRCALVHLPFFSLRLFPGGLAVSAATASSRLDYYNRLRLNDHHLTYLTYGGHDPLNILVLGQSVLKFVCQLATIGLQ